MADVKGEAADPVIAKAEALALAEEAEAEAAEAEALAAAARARARAIRLRRKAQVQAEAGAQAPEATEATDTGTEEATYSPLSLGLADPDGSSPRRLSLIRGQTIRTPTVAGAAAVIAIIGLLGASSYLVWHHHQAVERRQHQAAFIAAARQGIVNMTSFDFSKAKEDVQRVIDSSMGEFRDDFQQRAADFTTVVQQSKVVTEGSVTSAAVESIRDDSAVVLVLASERVTNAAGAKDEPREFRLRVTVAHDGDELKMSKVEFVL